jgi:hypothetical protein
MNSIFQDAFVDSRSEVRAGENNVLVRFGCIKFNGNASWLA